MAMKNILSIFIALALIAGCMQTNAQQVIATAGGEYQGENLALSFTIGEPVIETFSNGEFILTQGYQQPYSFYLQQILNIPAGWSGVSTYIDPINKGVEAIFTNHQNDLIMLASMTGIYYPAQSINTLGTWNIETGYRLKAESDFELTITGSKIETQSLELSQGWNILPVLSACNVDAESLFADLSSLQIVKEVAGTKVYWPAYGINTLENLIPGKAYFFASTDIETVIFPECTKLSAKKQPHEKAVNTTPWNALHYTASSHTVAFPAKVLAVSGILPGDVIGAFTPDGFCAGRLEITDPNKNVAITAFSNDEITTDKDGFENGEPLHFKVYRPGQDQEFVLDVSFDPSLPYMGYFAVHGFSAVQSLKLQALGISENSAFKFEVYPNPSHGVFNLSLSVWPENLQIQITDSRAQIVKSFDLSKKPYSSFHSFDLSYLPKGVYFLKLSDNQSSKIRKLIIN
jgi:hypothetical protein